jgi:hypothetical protein
MRLDTRRLQLMRAVRITKAQLRILARHFGAQPRRLTALLAFVAVVNLSRALPFLLHNAGL